MINYLLKGSICLLAFYLLYRFSFSRVKLLQANRLYLLSTAILSLVLPLITLDLTSVIAEDLGIYHTYNPLRAMASTKGLESSNTRNALEIIYVLGVSFSSTILCIKLLRVINIIHKSPKERQGNFLIVHSKFNSAFSFFNFIFLSKETLNDKNHLDTIIKHEQIHSRQLHSADILFFEIMGILFWFNPIIYALKNAVKLQHEFIADHLTSKVKSKRDYESLLIRYSLRKLDNSFFHGFAYHPIEKRIYMLNQKQTSIMKKLRLLLSLPLITLLLFGFNINAQTQEAVSQKLEMIISTKASLNDQSAKPAEMLSGQVVDDKGQSIANVTVTFFPSETSTKTDEKGNYKIKPSQKDERVTFEIKGYKKMEIPGGSSKSNVWNLTTLNVKLKKD